MRFCSSNIQEFERNNFDLLRLVFALMVVIVHIAELSLVASLEPITHIISSSLAVKCFFVISGFLIVRSYHNSSSLGRYFEKRIRRIYPAYLFVILVSAFLLVMFSGSRLSAYFSVDWLRYIVFNLLFLNFLQPSLPGVFEELRSTAVNGALWTLKVEVMFYVFVPFLALACSRFKTLKVLLILYFLSIIYANFMAFLHQRFGSAMYLSLGQQLPGQLSYFLGGSLLYYYYDIFKRYCAFFVLASVGGLVIDRFIGLVLFEPLALSIFVLFLATYRYLGNSSKYGDISYGVYILHFPIIQCLLTSGLQQQSPILFFVIALLLTVAGSFLLWHCIEKPYLSVTSHYKKKPVRALLENTRNTIY